MTKKLKFMISCYQSLAPIDLKLVIFKIIAKYAQKYAAAGIK